MIEIISKNIDVKKTARYYLLNSQSGKIKETWFALHGYSQNAEDFLKIFTGFAGGDKLIIAPEALNRFYARGFNGKIGASWMTREDRENEIKNYIEYLSALYKEIKKMFPDKFTNVNVLGFSQGTATACRWIFGSGLKFKKLVLWGGGIPPDVNLNENKTLINSLGLTMIIGDKDEFVPSEKLDAEEERLKAAGIDYNLIRYEGNHFITTELLERFAAQF